MTLFDEFKKYEVKAKSLEEFCEKYHKPEAYKQRGREYMQADLQSHKQDIEKYGYTFIPAFDSITGNIVAYYGK